MPEMDFDIITMGHGSGGLLTNKLLESGVFNLLKNEKLDTHHDGAVLAFNGQMAFSTDSFVISPIFFPGGNIGELAVNGTVNDVAMCGGIPQYLSLSFILEEGLRMEHFWEILVAVKAACARAGVMVVTGDTKVVEKGKGDKVFVNTTGIGPLHPEAAISPGRIRPGDKIVLSGNLATHGVAILSVRQGLEFETDIESDTCNLNHTIKTLLDEFGKDIHLLRDPTRGGAATVLNEIARDTRLGVELQQRALPVDEQVEGACEILGLDPLYVANEGIFIAVVSGDIAEPFTEKLRTLEHGQHAAIIGEVVEAHPRQVVLASSIGGKRVVNMPIGEQLPRIC
ncbi:MAG: hydrogenase expression/formation protein HypE [Lewinellaceae bacterium]|nr:hydrogenase expression/formation protein HypE [Lewinellaceae bacterium]